MDSLIPNLTWTTIATYSRFKFSFNFEKNPGQIVINLACLLREAIPGLASAVIRVIQGENGVHFNFFIQYQSGTVWDFESGHPSLTHDGVE